FTQAAVLRVFERTVVDAFELDADGEVVAPLTPAPAGGAGVPGALVHRNELDQRAVAAHQEMRRHLERMNLAEIRVRLRIEAVGEQALDRVAAVLPRRQADRVQQ